METWEWWKIQVKSLWKNGSVFDKVKFEAYAGRKIVSNMLCEKT